MMLHNLMSNVLIWPLKVDGTNYAASAGTTTLTSEEIDMTGYEGCLVIVSLGAVTDASVPNLSFNSASASGGTFAAVSPAVAASFTASTSSNTIMIIDLFRCRNRVLKTVLARATQNAAVLSATVIQYNARLKGITAHARVAASAIGAGSL